MPLKAQCYLKFDRSIRLLKNLNQKKTQISVKLECSLDKSVVWDILSLLISKTGGGEITSFLIIKLSN